MIFKFNILFIAFLMPVNILLYAQKLEKGISRQWPERKNTDKCCIEAELIDLEKFVHYDSIHYCFININIRNLDSNSVITYNSLIGEESDSTAFISLELYKKNGGNYIKQKKKDAEAIPEVFWPLKVTHYYIRLDGFFEIENNGEYKLTGSYKRICNKLVTFHKMDDIYIIIK